ncbi:MAG: tetratricopeptide repeat protein [Dorea sp.]|nr:tetratricopeptide repeat protein [Dorea sp.]
MKKIKVCFLLMAICMLFTACSNHASQAGVTHLMNSDYSAAIDSFQDAIEKQDNVADAYRGIGMARWEQENYEGCLSALQKALDNGVERTAPLYAMMGSCCMKLVDYDAAISYYELAMDLSAQGEPLMQELLRNRIVCYEKSGDLKKAKEYLEVYQQLYPTDENARREVQFLETRE